jgi:hypothetical protein
MTRFDDTETAEKRGIRMRKRMALAVLMLLTPGWAFAQTGPEYVLPAKSQLFFRWDGANAHRKEFEKTTFGKSMQGDTGKFLQELWSYAKDNIEQLLDQKDPQAAAIFKDITKALASVMHSGVAIGVELGGVNPPRATAVLAFPGAAGDKGTLLPLIQQAAEAAGADIKKENVGRRQVQRIEIPIPNTPANVYFGWWREASDAVVIVGTDDPIEYVRSVDAKKTGLAKNPYFQKVQGFKEFTTGSRGYFDMQGLAGVFEDLSPEAAKLVDALGVKGVKSITFVSGYDGPGFRDVTEIDMPGPRKGLLALTSSKKFSLKDLPPLPSDTTNFSASSLEVGKAYDVLVGLVESGVRIFAPEQAENIQPAIKAFEQILGVNFRDDLFGSFGDMSVSYSSPAEGPLGLGSTTLFKVKDGPKLVRSIETLIKNIPNMPGFEVSLKKKSYRDVEIMDLYFKANEFSSRLGSFAVYKDWFVFSQYPQGIKGFVLRSQGELPTWKANADLTKVLDQFSAKDFTSIQVSDPRSTLQFVFAAAPIVIDLANKLTPFVPNLRPFDLDLVPHAQEATRGLLPSVSITTDDGKRIRSESRSSVGLP